MHEDRSLLRELIGDGRPALSLTAVALLISGVFAIFLSFRREFLPHDVSYLGMSAAELCRFADCRIVRFMFHDRVAFGGTLIAVAVLYLWLAAFPLRQGAAWAWWAFVVSGTLGFASFLTYLGYGYLDMWHSTATLALLPTFTLGLLYSRRLATAPATPWIRTGEMKAAAWPLRLGRWGLLATGLGIGLAGLVILYLGSTEVFVVEDLGFMGVTRQMLDDINPRLVPLIAHDRAGFGGGLATIGVLLTICAVYSRPSRSFHEAVAIAGVAGFGCALGTHYVEGYVNPIHLAPAFAGAVLFGVSIGCEIIGSRTRKSSGVAAAAAVERRVVG
jgi:MFS family permease